MSKLPALLLLTGCLQPREHIPAYDQMILVYNGSTEEHELGIAWEVPGVVEYTAFSVNVPGEDWATIHAWLPVARPFNLGVRAGGDCLLDADSPLSQGTAYRCGMRPIIQPDRLPVVLGYYDDIGLVRLQ